MVLRLLYEFARSNNALNLPLRPVTARRLAATLSGPEVTTKRARQVWFATVAVGYLLYDVALIDMGGLEILFSPGSVRFPMVVLAWVGPVCLYILWANLSRINLIDMHMAYLPFVVWFVAAGWVFRSLTGFGSTFFQFSLVALLGGVYLGRFLLTRIAPRIGDRRAAMVCSLVWLTGCVAVAWLSPPMVD